MIHTPRNEPPQKSAAPPTPSPLFEPDKLKAAADERRKADQAETGGAEPGVCRSCGAKILWAKTEAGKTAPFDAHKTTVYVIREGVAMPLSGHVSHFGTCPNRDQHRRST